MNLPQQLIDKVRNGTRDVRLYICSKSLILFSIFYFSEFFIYKIPSFHELFYDDCENLVLGKLKEVLWIAFRESAKTSIVKIFIIWCICFDKKDYICYDSYDKDNAEAALFDIVENLQTNRKLIRDFGNLYTEERKKDKPLQKKITSFITANKIRVRAYSTQESARGMVYGNKRPNLVIFDDIETSKTKESRKITRKIIRHIKEFRGGIGTDASVIYLGNFISETGVIAWLKRKVGNEPTGQVRDISVVDKITGLLVWDDKYVFTDQEANEINSSISKQKEHKVSLEYKKRDLGERSFAEDMMNDPEAAGEPFFDRKKIDIAMKEVRKPIEVNAKFMIFSEYEPSHRYAFGADTSMGKGLDANASVAIDFTTIPNEQVGSYANNKIAPDIFGVELHRQSELFGECLIAPETNAKSGGACLTGLRVVHPIGKIYRQRGIGKAGDPVKKDLGWETNSATKPTMFMEFRTAWEKGLIKINDIRILKEMRSYTFMDLTDEMDADEMDEEDEEITNHFDLLTACVICWAVRHFATISDRDREEYIQPEYEAPTLGTNMDNRPPVPTLSPKNRIEALMNRKKDPDSYETETPWQAPSIVV